MHELVDWHLLCMWVLHNILLCVTDRSVGPISTTHEAAAASACSCNPSEHAIVMTRGDNVEEGGKLHQSRHFTEVLFHLWLRSSGQNLDMVEDSMAKAAIDAC